LPEQNDRWWEAPHIQRPWSGYEVQIIHRKGTLSDVLINIAAIPPTDQWVISLLDITESRKMEQEKREASRYARSLIEANLDPMMTVTAEGRIMDVNRATELMTGCSREQLIGSPFPDYFTEPERAQEGYRAVFSRGFVRDYPLAFKHVSGQVTEVHYNASLFRNEAGEIKGILVSARDVTERVAAEEKLLASNERLRSLTWELVMTEERERRRITVDLHDQIGQTMALTKLKLEALREQAAGCGEIAEPLGEIAEMVTQSIQQTRTLMRDLSPSVLYELGFTEAILWLGEQFQAQHGLHVLLHNELHIQRLEQEVELLLFRAIRELLMNVVKHAGVQQASVLLRKSGQNIKVWVKDDGAGFDASAFNQPSRRQSDGFGLLSIQERIRYIGGLFEIEARTGQGTCVHIVVPLKSRKQKGRRSQNR
jgi:PAS domain S-box-containing protein